MASDAETKDPLERRNVELSLTSLQENNLESRGETFFYVFRCEESCYLVET